MFEDSLFESHQRAVSARSRWTAVASITTQGLIIFLLLVIPLLHPESLPMPHELKAIMPLPTPPQPPKVVTQRASHAATSLVPVLGRMLVAPRTLPHRIDTSPEPDTAAVSFKDMGMANGLPLGTLFDSNNAPNSHAVSIAPERKPGPMPVSSGVSSGHLLTPIRPIYPSIAKAAHVEGTVVVEAVISKTGTIESLHVVSGPMMLQSAAINAIRAARYQPFLLNGAPTEVQTSITVNFRIGG